MAVNRIDIEHLLRRTEYVARPARVATLSAGTLEAAVDDILDVPPGAIEVPQAVLNQDPNEQWNTYVAMMQWWMDRMIDAPKPLQEKLTFFWHGHFVSAKSKVNETWLLANQNMLYRDNCVGDFHDLAQAMAIDPAMLAYLDNYSNTKWAPNQNFARESMELFTLGIGNYTESDVEAAARAWTGHTLDWTEGPNRLRYRFNPDDHDATDKTFMGVTRNWDGPDIITHILETDAQKKLVAARFIVAKLWEHFAHPGVPAAVLDALAPQFAADWQIAPLMRSLLLRPEFYSTQAKQGLVRTPVDYVVALMHQSGLRSAELHPEWFMEAMGQVPLSPPNVAGWKSNAYFINTSAVSARSEMVRFVTWRMLSNGDYSYLARMSIPDAIDEVTNIFAIAPVSTSTHDAIAGYLREQRLAEPWGGWWEPTNLLTLAMVAPEMHAA